ncbi:MAG: hypothetical protein JXA57_06090, partial [Armatimonadetes bacterium]|nr:hypothetical protein [Armatimonadota bacterium]
RWWSLVGVVYLVAVALRITQTGRVWGAPADLLSEGGSLGLGATLVTWTAGVATLAVSWDSFRTATRTAHHRGGFRLAALLFAMAGIFLLGSVRYLPGPGAVRNVVARSQTLIAALEAYEGEHGHYPESLDELVPHYLPEIPNTGYGVRREFHYYRAETSPASTNPQIRHADGRLWVGAAPYALVVEFVPSGTLVYRPTHDYSDLYRSRRIGDSGWGATAID